MSAYINYRSRDGQHNFKFRFEPNGSTIDIHVDEHPSFNGQDANAVYSHLYESGRICFVPGKEPRDMNRAQALAADWAEYFLRYRSTGRVES